MSQRSLHVTWLWLEGLGDFLVSPFLFFKRGNENLEAHDFAELMEP